VSASCPSCRRALANESRDALCLRCIAAGFEDEFANEPKTSPNIVPRALPLAQAA
jgi:hypothetical protein